jgi:hypothetical protein
LLCCCCLAVTLLYEVCLGYIVLMGSASNFSDVLALHDALSRLPFRCGDHSPKIRIVDRQKDGFVIAVKKKCCLMCIRSFLEGRGFSVSEDEKYLIVRIR